MRAVTLIAVVAGLVLMTAGCGDDEPTPSREAIDAAYGEGSDASGTRVEMSESRFAPTTLRVQAGATITFENADQIAHTATAVDGAKFDSGPVAAGDSYEWTAAKEGEVQYVCTFHPGMKATITVE